MSNKTRHNFRLFDNNLAPKEKKNRREFTLLCPPRESFGCCTEIPQYSARMSDDRFRIINLSFTRSFSKRVFVVDSIIKCYLNSNRFPNVPSSTGPLVKKKKGGGEKRGTFNSFDSVHVHRGYCYGCADRFECVPT